MAMLFLTDAQFDRARNDRSYPLDRVFSKLEMACGRHLDASPAQLRELSPVRNLLVWHSFISELSLMHALTDDERYLEHLLAFVRGLAGDGWRTVELTEHLHAPSILVALAGMHDLLGARLPAADADLLEDTMVSLAEFVWDDLHDGQWGSRERTVWNHNIIAYSALGVAGLALEGNRLAAEWLGIATERAGHFLDIGVSAAGMTYEGHHYCGYVFRHLGLFLQGLSTGGRLSAVVPEGSEREEKLHRVPRWYAHDLFPRGKWLQNYNDSHWDPHSALLGFLLSFARYEPELTIAVWDQLVGMPGRRTFGFDSRFSSLAEAMTFVPAIPIPTLAELDLDDHIFCPDVGYLSARNGWDQRASVFTFNSGPLVGRIHDHADNNSFTFIARGRPLVLDSGSANDPTDGSPSSSLGHNAVFVDGVGEGVAGAGMGVSGAILGVERTDDYVAVVGDATESYAAEGSSPVRQAVRHAVFVKKPVPYVVTYDDFDKDGLEHDYEYVVHVPQGEAPVPPTAALSIMTNTGDVGGRMGLLHPPGLRVTAQPYSTQRRPRGPYNNHTVWRIGTRAENPRFVMLFAPPRPTELAAEVTVEPTGVVVRLQWEFATDEIRMPGLRTGEPVRLPSLHR